MKAKGGRMKKSNLRSNAVSSSRLNCISPSGVEVLRSISSMSSDFETDSMADKKSGVARDNFIA